MKKIIANFLIVLTLLTGTSVFAAAKNATSNNNTETAANTDSFSDRFQVAAYKTRSHRFYLYAGDTVEIEMAGDGDTDLDLYIYDSNGNLIDQSVGGSDYEFSSLEIYKSSYFTVKVVNRGDVYNDYELLVDAY